MRVQCYVDGFNLYHAIADLNQKHLKRINLRSLAEAFIKPSQETLHDKFDKAIIVTADPDMVPAIQMVLDTFPEKQIVVCTPPNRYNIAREIRGIVETKKIKRKHLQRNLLPEIILDKKGNVLAKRPAVYDPPV